MPRPPLRALLISGGPSLEQNEYAIESNARYLETLTARAKWRRIYFADGRKTSRTIGAVETASASPAEMILGWILDDEENSAIGTGRAVRRASTLKRIDGASTKPQVVNALQLFARAGQNERGLLYFTGHGSPGIDVSLAGGEDFQNTTYALWNGGTLSVREMARGLKQWPATAPLVLVMVQCHAGGFANVMHEDGDPAKPLQQRDFCGFFAATGERQSAGCTDEMDERNYQDFTTHFFAALSGRTREGKRAPNADYDRNGAVSMSEAFAWASVYDRSIDVPVCTSDTFLRQTAGALEPLRSRNSWMRTPYSTVRAAATPWQRAMLDGLSRELHLAGETRVAQAMSAVGKADEESLAATTAGSTTTNSKTSAAEDAAARRFYRLASQVRRRFPHLRNKENSTESRRARRAALRYIAAQRKDVEVISKAYLDANAEIEGEVRDAMLLRFVRAARTVSLQNYLRQFGTAQQKQDFARLRRAESRNPL